VSLSAILLVLACLFLVGIIWTRILQEHRQ
jgi:hypothetical protein